jgi:hypothetical protein
MNDVLVNVGDDWVPAVVDRSRDVAVEGMLLRDVIADDEAEPETEESYERDGRTTAANVEQRPASPMPGPPVTAAAVSMAGTKFVVVVVSLSVASGPGESDLAIADLERRFGVPVVLMGQDDDGTPVYYGDDELKALLVGVPVDRLPWKEYSTT